ncbi:MAG: hypothetical protein AB1847_17765, partial [bacterium]
SLPNISPCTSPPRTSPPRTSPPEYISLALARIYQVLACIHQVTTRLLKHSLTDLLKHSHSFLYALTGDALHPSVQDASAALTVPL